MLVICSAAKKYGTFCFFLSFFGGGVFLGLLSAVCQLKPPWTKKRFPIHARRNAFGNAIAMVGGREEAEREGGGREGGKRERGGERRGRGEAEEKGVNWKVTGSKSTEFRKR